MRIIIIAAISQNGVIGTANGKMPWHVKEEFAHFKDTTFGSPVIMGRKTFETLGKPLKGRLNIVLTRSAQIPDVKNEVVCKHSLAEAIEYCKNENHEKVFIIGGREVYLQALSSADEMILSFMKFSVEGTMYFPAYEANDWIKTDERNFEQFSVVTFVRKRKN